MNNSLILPIAIVVLVVALLIFVRIIRVIVGLLFRIAIGVVATIIAVIWTFRYAHVLRLKAEQAENT